MRDQVEMLLNKHRVPEDLWHKCLEYFDYCWDRQLIFDKRKNWKDDLSKGLSNECSLAIKKQQLQKVPQFRTLTNIEYIALIRVLR